MMMTMMIFSVGMVVVFNISSMCVTVVFEHNKLQSSILIAK